MVFSEVLPSVYAVSVVPVVVSTLVMIALALLGLRRPRPTELVADRSEPFVSVIVPVFNDPVAVRCIEACLAFDYPARRFEIVVLDDSTEPVTRALLSALATKHPERVVYRHRSHREGYKAGALVAATPLLRGSLFAIFDADFVPDPALLVKLVAPFQDPRVAIVQARQGFLNEERTLVARFAAALLSVHHHVMLPAAARLGVVFFCGTAGALRRAALEDAGGWNAKSITEDADLSVRLLAKGWRAIYLPIEVPSEVPVTLRAFLRQQMRWCFGSVRVFLDHMKLIVRAPAFGLGQRLLITYLTLGNLVAVPVAAMTLAGIASWGAVGFGAASGLDGRVGIACTLCFLLVTTLALQRRGCLRNIAWVAVGACTIALFLAFANATAAIRALVSSQRPLFDGTTSWICTPKSGNTGYRTAG